MRVGAEVRRGLARLRRRRPDPVQALLAGAPRAVVIEPGRADEPGLATELLAGAPYDVVVDLTGSRRVLRTVVARAGLLAPGGTLAVRLPDGPHGPTLPGRTARALERVAAFRDAGAPEERAAIGRRRDLLGLAATTGPAEVRDGFLVVPVTRATWAKTTERSFSDLVAGGRWAGADRVRDIATVESRRWQSRAVVRSSEPERAAALPERFAAGDLTLRAVADARCWPRQIAAVDRVLLPGSFPRDRARARRNPGLRDISAGSALPRDDRPPTSLGGTWFGLDNVARGHFGHALTEQLSLTWAWAAAVRDHSDLRVLVGPDLTRDGEGRRGLQPWELDLYVAAGVPVDRIEVVDGPVVVERLLVASPAYRIPLEVHPVVGEVWAATGAALAAQRTQPEAPARRVFLTRRTGNRICHNAEEVEQRFAEAGFAVVRPETLPLAEQVGLVRDAEVVAGFAGSGMFGVALAGGPRHVITVAPASYMARNEYVMSALLGHRLDTVLCRPDVPRGPRFRPEAFHSGFTYDAEREGRFLDRVLAEL